MGKEKSVLLGVSGGIAAFKAATLTSLLVKAGVEVSVVMTEAATQLVAPKTFEALSGYPVFTSMWDPRFIHPHIELSRHANLFCIAPATANVIGKVANGIADDLLTSVYLAFSGKIIIAPAMNSVMWSKPSVQRNCKQLLEDGVILVGPTTGRLSCGESGLGRMVEAEKIFETIMSELDRA
ncbi:MAG: flavoprotein [Thermoguttaceae bacterium]